MKSPLTQAEKEAIEYGIDVNLIEYNLSLTYKERFKQHQQALNTVLALQAAGQKMRDEQSLRNPKSPIRR